MRRGFILTATVLTGLGTYYERERILEVGVGPRKAQRGYLWVVLYSIGDGIAMWTRTWSWKLPKLRKGIVADEDVQARTD